MTMEIKLQSQTQGLKAIDAIIKKVPLAYEKAHNIVQEAAVSIVQHSMEYGDCSRALTLVRAIPVNQARSLILYFLAVSPIGVLLSKSKKDDKVRLLKEDSKSYNPYDLDKAKALSWWTMDNDQALKEAINVTSSDVFDQLLKLADRLATAKDTDAKTYSLGASQAATLSKEAITKVRSAFLAAQEASKPKGMEDVSMSNSTVDPVLSAVNG